MHARARPPAGLQLEACRGAAAAEVAALHDKHAARLKLVEDFKNSVLADKRGAEDKWAKERAAITVCVQLLGMPACAHASPSLGPRRAWGQQAGMYMKALASCQAASQQCMALAA